MVNPKGKRGASASNSISKTNGAANLVPNQTTASSSMKTSVVETVVVSEIEDTEGTVVEKVKTVETTIDEEKNEVNAVEAEEKDEENETEEEDDVVESEEDDVVESEEDDVVEGEEDDIADGEEDDVVEGEEDEAEGEENGENAAGEEKKEEKVEVVSKGKTKKFGKKNSMKKVARGISKENSKENVVVGGGGEENDENAKGEEKKEEENDENAKGEEKKEEENDENAKGEEKKEEKVEAESKGKTKKKNRRKKVAQGSSKEKSDKDKDKPESSGKKKASKKVESMGMIFMCSSKTKKDCYRYGVFGLPASKRDTVQKVYKGMRLFLFDVDLRLMYGIYKASGPGGYNIEPEAFKSDFPAQVRFTVLNDCLPVAEEKFKTVIKENYYTRNKFNCHLTSEQVKNLCKLFLPAGKGPGSKKLVRSLGAETRTFVGRDRKRRRAPAEEKRSAYGGERRYHEPPAMYERGDGKRRLAAMHERGDGKRRRAAMHEGGDRKRKRAAMHEGGDRKRKRALDEKKRSAFGGERRYHERPPMYEREAFASPLAPLPRVAALPPPGLHPSYAFERTLEMDPYGRDPLFERRGPRHSDLEPRRRDEIEYRDPYNSYMDPYSYRDPLHSAGLQPEYHRPAVSTSSEYRVAGFPSEYRHAAAVPLPEYNPGHAAVPLPEYNPGRSLYRY